MFDKYKVLEKLFNPNLDGGGGNFTPCWLSLNNSRILQHSVTFYYKSSCQIWYSLLAPVFRYWAKLRRGYFRSPDLWSIPYKRTCHNSRTSHNIDMKLGPVTKLDKRNKTRQKIWRWRHVYGQFRAIRKPDSGRVVCKTYIFINSNLLSYKNWNSELKNL